MYSTNEMFHSIEFEKETPITYLKYFKESRDLAKEYFSYKEKNSNNDVAYTKSNR